MLFVYFGIEIIAFGLMLIYGIIAVLKNTKKLFGYIILGITIAAITLSCFFPMTSLYRAIDYSVQRHGRMRVASLIENGELKLTSLTTYRLPFIYRATSRTAEVTVKSENSAYGGFSDDASFLVFYVYESSRAFGRDAWCVIYSPQDKNPADEGLPYTEVIRCEKIEDNWYSARIRGDF
jgi:hypothetical protein